MFMGCGEGVGWCSIGKGEEKQKYYKYDEGQKVVGSKFGIFHIKHKTIHRLTLEHKNTKIIQTSSIHVV